MLNSKQSEQRQQQNSNFIETLQHKLKDIKNFSQLSEKKQMLVAGAVGAIFSIAVPVLAVALPFAAAGAIVGLTLFFAVKTVEYAFKGLKWSAEKTVEGAKHIGEKIKDGAVYAKNLTKEAASSVGQATREGTSSALKTMGNSVQSIGRKMSNGGASMSSLDSIPYSIDNENQTVVLKTEEKTKNFNSVREMLVNEILQDKTVNKSALIKEVFPQLKGKILEKAYSIDGQQGFKKDQLINQLKQQADFINKLDDKKLQNLLAQDDNNLYEIFSEYHSDIKKIIKECKIEHKLSNSIENLNKVASKYGESKKVSNVKYQVLGAAPTVPIREKPRRNSTGNLTHSLTREVQNISASLTNLNEGMNSFSHSSLSENDPTVKRKFDNKTLILSNSVSSLASDSSYSSAISTLSGIDESVASKSSSFNDLSDSDSGRGASIPSTPERMIISSDDLMKAKSQLRKVDFHEKISEQQPSTFMSGQEPIQVTQSLQTSI